MVLYTWSRARAHAAPAPDLRLGRVGTLAENLKTVRKRALRQHTDKLADECAYHTKSSSFWDTNARLVGFVVCGVCGCAGKAKSNLPSPLPHTRGSLIIIIPPQPLDLLCLQSHHTQHQNMPHTPAQNTGASLALNARPPAANQTCPRLCVPATRLALITQPPKVALSLPPLYPPPSPSLHSTPPPGGL